MRYFKLCSVILVSWALSVPAYAQYPAVTATSFTPKIPRTWDPVAMAGLELPLRDAAFSPVHVTAEYYYGLPVRPIYKS